MEGDLAAIDSLMQNSHAPFIVKIILKDGATVRSGVEIENNESVVRNLACGEVVESFKKSLTREGIPRYQIVDGWISEYLRTDSVESEGEKVLLVLRELPLVPIQYQVSRVGGAKLRVGKSKSKSSGVVH